MNISRGTIAATMVLFLSGIGADNCGFYWPTPAGMGGMSGAAPPMKPFCMTDPPKGCRATCASLDMPGFSIQCDEISAGPLTAKFEQTVLANLAAFEMMGGEPCDQAEVDMGVVVTPCRVGIMPVQVESSDACMPPPPGCL